MIDELCRYCRARLAPYLRDHAGFPNLCDDERDRLIRDVVNGCCGYWRGREPWHWFGPEYTPSSEGSP